MPEITCPKCGAAQDPEEGDLSLSCGSILVDTGVPDLIMHYQSNECKLAMLTKQRDAWREMARQAVDLMEQMTGTPVVRQRAILLIAAYKILEDHAASIDATPI